MGIVRIPCQAAGKGGSNLLTVKEGPVVAKHPLTSVSLGKIRTQSEGGAVLQSKDKTIVSPLPLRLRSGQTLGLSELRVGGRRRRTGRSRWRWSIGGRWPCAPESGNDPSLFSHPAWRLSTSPGALSVFRPSTTALANSTVGFASLTPNPPSP